MKIFTVTFFLALAIALVASILIFDPNLTQTRSLVASMKIEQSNDAQATQTASNKTAGSTSEKTASADKTSDAKRESKAYDSCMRILPDCWQNHKRICSCVSNTVMKSFNDEDWDNFKHIQISGNGFSISLPKQSAQTTASKFNSAIGSCRK